MTVRKITANQKCEYGNCQKEATTLTYDLLNGRVGCFCDDHSEQVVERTEPEYVRSCPNCGCVMGV